MDYLTIIVGRNTDKLWGNHFSDIIWNEHLELISEIRFYKIGRKNNYFFGTKQEAIDAMCKYYDRFDFRNLYDKDRDEIIFSDKAKEIILPFIKRQRKCKSINVKEWFKMGLIQDLATIIGAGVTGEDVKSLIEKDMIEKGIPTNKEDWLWFYCYC